MVINNMVRFLIKFIKRTIGLATHFYTGCINQPMILERVYSTLIIGINKPKIFLLISETHMKFKILSKFNACEKNAK